MAAMKKIFGGFVVAVCLLLAIHFSFSRRAYNVVLITIDTLRADHVSCYNPHAQPTPNIDRIADHGTRYIGMGSRLRTRTMGSRGSLTEAARAGNDRVIVRGRQKESNRHRI